jgi:hypothetical protein
VTPIDVEVQDKANSARTAAAPARIGMSAACSAAKLATSAKSIRRPYNPAVPRACWKPGTRLGVYEILASVGADSILIASPSQASR